jgi:ABC-type nickel/cobalt efflux system permease component RcnA
MIKRITRVMPLLILAVFALVFALGGPRDAAADPSRSQHAVQLAGLSSDRALTAQRPAASQPAAQSPGMFERAYNWILVQQQRLNRELAAAVKELKAAGSFTAAAVLGFIGFSYGVLHAAGPGHGKAVISSYVLANERTVRRGIFLSFLAAFIQALSAIVLVGVLAIALNATSLEMRSAEAWIETVSWGFVALVGLWLLVGQFRQILARRALAREVPSSHGHADSQHRGRDHSAACCGHGPHGHDHHGHRHDHGHDHAHATTCAHTHGDGKHDHACCGHAHMPDPKALEGDLSWSKALAIAFSVGIRPCTGAILVLVFALSQGLVWAGVFATFAMALGTAITVSVLAALAVGSRELAVKLGGGDSKWATGVATAAGLAGSTLVLVMGTVFFIGSLTSPSPL